MLPTFLTGRQWDFLPGRLALARGASRDYRTLAPFHYAAGRPATWAGVWVVRFESKQGAEPRVVAIGVLSWPILSCAARERYLSLAGSRRDTTDFVNQHLRTISQIIVHPQFRGLGLSTRLVQCICENCETRYVEAIAKMGRFNPLFERAGMKRIDPLRDDESTYYIFDRTRVLKNPLPHPLPEYRERA